MSNIVKIKKGLDVKLKGEAEKVFAKAELSEAYAVKPSDFRGLTLKAVVQPDEEVKAGTPLLQDKNNPDIKIVSPVSGKVLAVNRGEKRVLLNVAVTPDGKNEHETFKVSDPLKLSREEVVSTLLQSGCWPYLIQRPYGVVANPSETPKAIFISGFDSAPLAPDYDLMIQGNEAELQIGINALTRLTSGKIHLSLSGNYPANPVLDKVKNVTFHYFEGPHPAGNVGVQIHKIDPINKGEVVWTIRPQDIIIIGRLFSKGIYDATRMVALAGSEVHKPRYYKVISGAKVSSITHNNIEKNNVRIIGGNVLTGTTLSDDNFLGFYDSQLTVIPEGNYFEFAGWAAPRLNKFSTSRSYFSWLTPAKQYRLDTNLNGGERAFVMTGQYEKVFPMDIYPVQLLKAIMAQDIEMMENLGIYEVVEEDFALCEFVCTSKIDSQEIVRNGIDLMIKELS